MITVYCIYWGNKYPDTYPSTLARMVKRNLHMDFRFVVISDRQFGLDKLMNVDDVFAPVCDFPGWWQKIGLFHPNLADGPSLFLDLDVIICGDMTPMVERYMGCDLAMIRDWSSGGYATVCTFWNPSDITDRIWQEFDPEYIKQVHGDQDYVHHIVTGLPLRTIPGGSNVNDPAPDVTMIEPGYVVSYKRHCQGREPPEGACVVAFHGRPDWHECNEKWIGRAAL